jgi:peptidoglycan/LPS O-acetylase OafA/YrhL
MRRSPSAYSRLSVAGAAATDHRRSANLDVVRAVAALMVVVAHSIAFAVPDGARLSPWAGRSVSFLSNGIWLFFVLSGYLISGPFVRALATGQPQPPIGRYLVRRSARIVPAYWAALAVVVILATAKDLHHWWDFPVHAFLVQDLFPHQQTTVLFVAWTLSIEAMFYVFVPLVAALAWRAARRRPIPVNKLAFGIVAIFAGSVLWRLGDSFLVTPQQLVAGHVGWNREVFAWMLPSFLCAFAPGMLIFLAENCAADEPGTLWSSYRWAKQRAGLMLALAFASGVAFTLLTAKGGRWFEIGTALLALPAMFGVIAMMGESPRKLALGRVLGPIGLISYGIYLWHAVIRDVVLYHRNPLPLANAGLHTWPFQALLLIALTVPVALASWLIIERPLLRVTTSWDRRRAVVPSAAETMAATTPAAVTP